MKSSYEAHNVVSASGFQQPSDPARAARLERLEALAARNRELLNASERARFWFAVKICLMCVLGCLVGLVPMAWAMHTTDVQAAGVAWAAGPVIGNSIVIITLIIGWIKWQREEW